MEAVLITVYLIIVIALIAVILLQRSEGGGLGMGTSGNNGLVTVRGSANLLTRTTAILATLFFATAIGLTILSEVDRGTESILQRAADGVGEGAGDITVLDALNALQPQDTGLAIPAGDGAVAPAADAAAPATDTPAADAAATPAAEAPAAADPALAVPSTDTPAAPTDGGTQTPATDSQPADGAAPAAPVN
jgi:preprotein translocase subunit SecG